MRIRACITCGVAVVALAACGGGEPQAEPAPPPAPINLTELAGSWAFGAREEVTDSAVLFYKVVATADTTGWTIELPGREPMPMRVRVDADSLVTELGPYESVLRKGVQVTTRNVLRYVDGRLTGMVVARYQTGSADSVVRFKTDGTKTQ